MIFTDRTIIVQKGTSSINDTIVLYRGDKDVEIRFTLNEGSPFKFGSGASPNIIEKTEATYGQLVIKTPGALPSIFSEVAPTIGGKIIFTITAEMIDEITEVGNYTFQIRLFDENKESRATLPEVKNGIEIREPIATEDVSTTNEVGVATVGYALTTAGTSEDAFDTQGNYNKTTWQTGDRITAAKLNKIEAGIDGVNKKVVSGGSGGEVDLSGYVTKEIGNASQITFADGQTFQAKLDAGTLKGEKGDTGEQGPAGADGADGLTTSISVNGTTYTQADGIITLPNYPTGTGSNNAGDISITDTENYFTNSDVEGALQEVGSQIKEKVTKDEAGVITSAMLSQDVKESMTGGSVAVVGRNSVSNINIIDNQVDAKKITFLQQDHGNLFNKNDENNLADTTINGSGVATAGTGFTMSGFIKVYGDMTYFYNSITNVAEYDKDQTFIQRSAYNGSGVGSITLATNTEYVRLAVQTHVIDSAYFSLNDVFHEYGTPLIMNFSDNLDGEAFKLFLNKNVYAATSSYFEEFFFNQRNIYTTEGLVSGVVINGSSGGEAAHTDYFASAFIPVEKNTTYYCDFENYATVALYDSEKKFIKREAWDVKSFATDRAAYIRVTAKIGSEEKYHISKFPINRSYNKEFREEINKLVSTSGGIEIPIITFIDDDATSNFLTKSKPIFDSHNIKVGIGVITNKVGTTGHMTLDELKQLQTEGHIITSHSSDHAVELYKKDNYELFDNLDSVYEADMNGSLNYLAKNGMDTDIFIYPAGWYSGTKYEKMMIRNTSKFYKYAVDNGTTYETTNNIKPNMIKRIFIRDANGLDYYKGLIDEAKNNKYALLVFGTHSGFDEVTADFLSQVVEYAVNSGITIQDPKKAFENKIG